MDQDRILITGATGFIGRLVVRHFLSTGQPLTLAVRSGDARPPLLRGDQRLRIVATGPIETATNLGEALAGASTVVHLAGLAHVRHVAGADDPFMAANAIATQRLAKAAAERRVRAFIHMSSLAATTPNAALTVVDDTTCDTAPTPYGRTKREAEKHVLALAGEDILAVSLRPPLVVGAQAKGNWGLLLRLAASGVPLPFASISNRRSLIGVASLVAAVDCLCAGQWSAEKSGNYCIADEESLSLPRIITELRRGMGLAPRLFHFPAGLLHAMGQAVNRRQMADGLLGDLVVDAGRFRETFHFRQPQPLAAAIAESGMLYRRLSDGSGDMPG